jgi:hypothetical protein
MPSEPSVAAGSAPSAEPAGHDGGLTVWVGAPDSARALPAAGRLLVVEAEQEKADQLRRNLLQRNEATVRVEVLSAQSGSSVMWFRFNASRLNGPLPVETWREAYPNLQRTGEETRVGRSLADLLNDWMSQVETRQRPLLRLRLGQGDPLAALGGLGDWLSELDAVELAVPGAREVWEVPVDHWLKERGFCDGEAAGTSWRRDPVATQRLLLAEKEQRIAQLEDQLASQAERLKEVQIRADDWSTSCDQLRTSLAHLTAERQALLEERDQQRARADALARQCDAFSAELDQLLARLDQGVVGIGADPPSR